MTCNDRWMLVLPPEGAARNVASKAADAFQKKLGPDLFKCFDSLTYTQAFSKLLRESDETLTVDLLNQSLIVACLDFSTNHLITGALSPVTLFTLNLLRKQKVTTTHWFYEDIHRALYWKDIITGYDHFCTIQIGEFPEICKKNGTSYHFLPTATTFTDTDILPLQQDLFDIAFIGIPSSYRISVLEKLYLSGFSVAIAGSGWGTYSGPLEKVILSKSWTNNAQVQTILSQSKIGINLSVENPISRENVHISPRVYDIMVCGATLLTEDVPLIYDSLPDCSFYTFAGPDDLYLKVKTILLGTDLDKKTAYKNRMQVLNNHTFENRVDQLMGIITGDR
jgi:spore maturation protein CgeB